MTKNIIPLVLFIFIMNYSSVFSQSDTANISHSNSINSKIEDEKLYKGDYLYAFPPYPIPAKETVNSLVYWDKRYDFNNADINVYNTEGTKISGKERVTITQQSDWSSIVSWNAANFPSGIYIILIKHGSKTLSVKVVIA